MDRTILALCAICIRMPQGLDSYFNLAAELLLNSGLGSDSNSGSAISTITTGSTSGGGNGSISEEANLSRVIQGLRMLTILPEEVDAADVSRTVRTELERHMQNMSAEFARLADNLAPFALHSRDLYLALVKQGSAWLTPSGMTLSKLYTDYRQSFDLVCVTAFQMGDTELVNASCELLRNIISMYEYPRSAVRDEAVMMAVAALTQYSLPVVASASSNQQQAQADPSNNEGEFGIDDEIIRLLMDICQTQLSIFSAEMQLLTSKAKAGSSSAFVISFFQLFMELIRLKPRKFASSTFDFWGDLQDNPTSEWHPHIREKVLPQLLEILLAHCQYPSQAMRSWLQSSEGVEEDQEDFTAFRDTRMGLAELFNICFTTLGGQFFASLQAHFSAAFCGPSRVLEMDGSSAAAAGEANQQMAQSMQAVQNLLSNGGATALLSTHWAHLLKRWSHLEVVLFVLQCTMDSLKSSICEQNCDAGFRHSVLMFLYNVTTTVMAIPSSEYASPSNNLSLLQDTVCKYLGSITFMLCSGPGVGTPPISSPHGVSGRNFGKHADFSFTDANGCVQTLGQFYFQALQFAFEAIASSIGSTSIAAARSFHKLCIHGVNVLKDSAVDSTSGSLATDGNVLIMLIDGLANFFQQGLGTLGNAGTGAGAASPLGPDTAAMLIAVESITRTVMSLNSPSGVPVQQQLLSKIGENLCVCIQAEMHPVVPTPTVSARRIERLLSYVSQMVRFSDVQNEQTTGHPLLPFLGTFWPLLRSISTDGRVNGDQAVLAEIFNVYGKVMMSVGSAALSEVPSIVQAILVVAQMRQPIEASVGSGSASGGCGGAVAGQLTTGAAASAAALRCAAVLVECLVHHLPDRAARSPTLHGLVNGITDSYLSTSNFAQMYDETALSVNGTECMFIFGPDTDSMDSYFTLIHTYLLFCRHDFAVNEGSLSDKVLSLAEVCLRRCREKEPLRPLLQVVQALFAPSAAMSRINSNSTSSDAAAAVAASTTASASAVEAEEVQSIVMVVCRRHGPRFVRTLLLMLSTAAVPPQLVTNISDSLHCVIAGCSTTDAHVAECKSWLEGVVFNPVFFTPLVQPEQRQLLLHLMMSFSLYQNRRFKSLVQDLYKICSSELTVETLLAYADAL